VVNVKPIQDAIDDILFFERQLDPIAVILAK
jgi:hypothetical protein